MFLFLFNAQHISQIRLGLVYFLKLSQNRRIFFLDYRQFLIVYFEDWILKSAFEDNQ